MLVDRAHVGAPGTGRVQAWAEQASGEHTAALAAAWVPIDRVELGASVARNTTLGTTVQAVQAKWQIVRPAQRGCAAALAVGAGRESLWGIHTRWVGGLGSCSIGPGTLHLSLTVAQVTHLKTFSYSGYAWEQDLGFATGQVEVVLLPEASPIIHLGLRRSIGPGLTVGASLGRAHGQRLLGLSLTQRF